MSDVICLVVGTNNIKQTFVSSCLEWLVRLKQPIRLVAVSRYDSFNGSVWHLAAFHGAIEPTAMDVLLSQCRTRYLKRDLTECFRLRHFGRLSCLGYLRGSSCIGTNDCALPQSPGACRRMLHTMNEQGTTLTCSTVFSWARAVKRTKMPRSCK
jgi:hypothetical protein